MGNNLGVLPSQTSYYALPSTAIRICHGGRDGRCYCTGGYHRKEKYVYVDRRSDGRERYHDMMDLMGKYIMGQGGGGGGGSMMGGMQGGVGNIGGVGQGGMGWPFRDAREWTIRDYDRLGEVMKEFYDRERGRGRWAPCEHGMNNGGAGPPMMGMGMYPGMMGMNPQMMPNMPPQPTPMMPQYQHQHQHPSMEEFQRLQSDLEEKFREYNRHMGVLFGTEQDRQKDQYRATMLKTLQEIMPQLAQMMAQQRMSPMMNMGMGMGVPQGMNMPQMQNPMAYGPQPNPGMMGMGQPQMQMPQSPYNAGMAGQGYYSEPPSMPPRRPYRRRKWQDRYDDGDAFCSDNEPARRSTPWDSHAHHPGPGGRFGGRRDEDFGDGGAMPSRPRPRPPGPGPFDSTDPFPHTHPRPNRFTHPPPPPAATMSMPDIIPPTIPPLGASPHLGRRPVDTVPPFPSSRPGLARTTTAFRPSHLDPDFDAGPSGANVRINIDPQMEAGAAYMGGGLGDGVGRSTMGSGGDLGRSAMAGGLGTASMGGGLGRSAMDGGGVSSMRTAVGMQGMSGGYVPETGKLSQGRDVEDRRDEPDVGQGITDHTGR